MQSGLLMHGISLTELDRSLGRYDSNVYKNMFFRPSELNPLNAITADPYPKSGVLFKDTSSKVSFESVR